MNVFLGAFIPEQDMETLNNFILQAHPSWQKHKHIRWTASFNHHLTLHFFGKILPADLKAWLASIGQELKAIKGFSINILKISHFPKPDSDLVAAYVELNSALAHLYHRVEQSVRQHGFPVEERPYLPHITLCRSKRRHVLRMSSIIIADFKVEITRLALFQSQCIEGTSSYLPLHQWNLIPPSHGREL